MEIDHSVEKNEEFRPFLIEKNNIDIHAYFCKCDALLPLPKQFIYTDKCYQIALDEKGNYVKLFYESPEDPVCYAMSVYEPLRQRITVQYLESYERCVSEVQNCFYLLGFEMILIEKNKLCFHAACIETALGGILFSGVSGIGKSTQAELWCKYREARQINGDRPILSKEDQGWTAWGSPYAGSSKYHVNDKCLIKAIILLKKADSCTMRRLTAAEAFRGIWEGLTVCSWDTSFVERASALTVDLISKVPVYEFWCTPDEQAVDYLESILREEMKL